MTSLDQIVYAPGDQEIEVDTSFDDDSAVGSVEDRLSQYSQSLSSSVIAYPIEHGRRYHAYKDGSYIMPNDENEADRLDLLHHMLMILFDGKRIHSPVKRENLRRVLDAGTGTGIWAIDVGDEYPEAEVIGNDLSPTQPQWVPPNVKFEVDDIEEPWTYAEPFDLIFSRYMDAAISNWPALVANMFASTRPGGWAELQGFDTHYKSDDGSLPVDSYIHKFVGMLEEGCTKLGKEVYTGPTFAGLLKDAGFVNVHVQKYKLPLGPWPKDKKMKEVGTVNLMQVLEGMEAFSYRLFTGILGWSLEEVQVLIAKTTKELKSMKYHAYDEL
ncbi:methyltransferase domain-containing protein [Diplodia corticola]|uniref:Methyltransferase domain-containing protein n=1 Tax=Diplodia corticola TaxID=236234 RepID=A0A1J9RXL2_9PEZI|nr:methyltransferase domain-containing protein [Diplodia corticola]OJD32213.1 methyltransferase domain-containing protein [Diplodia corticola]